MTRTPTAVDKMSNKSGFVPVHPSPFGCDDAARHRQFGRNRRRDCTRDDLVPSLGSLRHTIRRRYIDVHVVANLEFGLCQRQQIVAAPLAGARDADLTHPIADGERVRRDEGKVEVGALAPCLRVYLAHQAGELAQRRIRPSVDLELVGRHVAVLELVGRMMAAGRAEYAQQQWASLCANETMNSNDYPPIHMLRRECSVRLTFSLSICFGGGFFSSTIIDSTPAIFVEYISFVEILTA